MDTEQPAQPSQEPSQEPSAQPAATRHQCSLSITQFGKYLIFACAGCGASQKWKPLSVLRKMVKGCRCRPTLRQTGNHPLHNHWRYMINSCYSSWHSNYSKVGALGIKVCNRWHTFANYVEDVGSPPGPRTSWCYCRIDPAKDFSPDNCRWFTRLERMRHVPSAVAVTKLWYTRERLSGPSREQVTLRQLSLLTELPYIRLLRIWKKHPTDDADELLRRYNSKWRALDEFHAASS